MGIMLGNLTIEEMETRLGVTFPEPLKERLRATHQMEASVEPGRWHCFDVPFRIVVGGNELAKEIVDALTPMAKDFTFTGSLQVGVVK